MADLVDLGNDRAEQQLGDILAARQRPATIVGSATCLYCGEAIQHDPTLRIAQRWCDSDCRDEWEKRHPSARAASPREPVITSGATGTQIRKAGRGPHGGTEANHLRDLMTLRAGAEADTAKIALRGYR